MTEQERVEKVAEAMWGVLVGDLLWEYYPQCHMEYRMAARAAIAAMQPTPQMQCIHMTAEMAAKCPTCNPPALRGLPTGIVEVCPICDIAGCHHIRERNAAPYTVTPQEAAKVLPDSVMVWHSSHTLDHLGTWSTTRYPEYAKEYVPRAKFDRMQQAAQLGLDMAKANDLWNTAETISRAIASEDSK